MAAIPGVPGKDYPILSAAGLTEISHRTGFSCPDNNVGGRENYLTSYYQHQYFIPSSLVLSKLSQHDLKKLIINFKTTRSGIQIRTIVKQISLLQSILLTEGLRADVRCSTSVLAPRPQHSSPSSVPTELSSTNSTSPATGGSMWTANTTEPWSLIASHQVSQTPHQ